jgi:type I restriction enzyme S subunit
MVGFETRRLGDGVLKVGHGKSQHEIESVAGKYPILATSGEIGRTDCYLYNKPSVLIGRKGTIDKPQYMDTPFWTIDTLFYTIVSEEHLAKYLYYLFCTIKWSKYNEASGVPSLSAKVIEDIEVNLPPLPEQRAIAAALSDVDGYIAALERLIAKKGNIKKGAMQEMLTGKRRLPGFDGEWVEKELIEIADFYDNLRIPVTESKREVGTTPYYGANGIQGYIKGYTHDGEYVLIAEDGANDLNNYPVLHVNGKVWVNNHAHVIQGIAGKAKTKYLSYALKTVDFVQVLVGGTRAKLNGSVAKAINVKIPNDIDEQTAIAELLSDMDSEIDALTAKLNKVRNIKQGMMQELLTGRIRLLEQDSEAVTEVKIVELPKREPTTTVSQTGGHNQQFDDAVMIAGIVNALYSDKFPLGRKKVQKCLYLLRRHQDESTTAFKKKAAGPYADEVRYKGGEPIARSAKYITTTTTKDKGTTFARGDKISQALAYIERWGRQADIKWLTDKLKYKSGNDLELLATVDMAICDLQEAGTPDSVASIKHLIATNEEWKAKLKKQTFSDANIASAIKELQTLLKGVNE